jgi:shikimate kinase
MVSLVKPILLIGPMGVGKTTIGKKLAKFLSVEFVDTDFLVEKKHGPIERIFATEGEAAFRKHETDALKTAITSAGVIATGGGIVISDTNRPLLKKGLVIYLSTTGRHISARLIAGKRPLIKNGYKDWQRIYEERRSTYEALSDLEVLTSGKSISRTVLEIVDRINTYE